MFRNDKIARMIPSMKKRGPKTEPGVGTLTARTVTLDDQTWSRLLVLGDGNASQGIRAAARVAYDRYQRTPDALPEVLPRPPYAR